MFSAADLAAKVPAAKTEDVNSMAAILHAIYDVISGPAGGRDWNRFRSVFLPQARFTEVSTGPDGSKWSSPGMSMSLFAMLVKSFPKMRFMKKAIVTGRKVLAISHKCSAATIRRNPTDKPFERGINSIQLLNDGKRWWVV